MSNVVRTVLKLFVLSLLAGLVMHWLDLTLLRLLESLGENARRFAEWVRGFLGWAVEYVLLGAVVVVPVWALAVLVGRFRH